MLSNGAEVENRRLPSSFPYFKEKTKINTGKDDRKKSLNALLALNVLFYAADQRVARRHYIVSYAHGIADFGTAHDFEVGGLAIDRRVSMRRIGNQL